MNPKFSLKKIFAAFSIGTAGFAFTAPSFAQEKPLETPTYASCKSNKMPDEQDSADEKFDHALARGDLFCVKEALNHGASLEGNPASRYSPLGWPARYHQVAILQELLDRGANVDSRSAHARNSTPLMIASSEGHVDIVRILLARGADINAVDKEGNTALIRAVMSGETKTVKELLAHKPDLEIRGDTSRTALMWAARVRQDNMEEIVKDLIAAGAKLSLKDQYGATALRLAESEGNTQVAQIIKDEIARRASPKAVPKSPKR